MSTPIRFLSPRLVGKRFEGHAIPLEVLKDLAVLEEMVIEVAKWRYLQEHPDRKRSPRGFTDGVSLKLTAIGDGSAVPQVDLFIDTAELFPPGSQVYFEEARTSIIGAINAAANDESIGEHLPDSLLGYFDRIGRSLRDDEVIEFDPTNSNRPARLNRATRRKLVLASSQVQEMTEEVTLRGAVPEADQGKMSFELKIIGGPRISAPIATHQMATVLEAFNGYRDGTRVLLQGIGRYSRYDRIQSIESIEHISILDANDIAARLDEFRGLKNGWLDGKGFAPSKQGLDWLTQRFVTQYPDDLPLPYLYPTAEGGVQAEWSLAGCEISLEIDFATKMGEWHALDMASQKETTCEPRLDDDAVWRWLVEQIQQLSGGGQ